MCRYWSASSSSDAPRVLEHTAGEKSQTGLDSCQRTLQRVCSRWKAVAGPTAGGVFPWPISGEIAFAISQGSRGGGSQCGAALSATCCSTTALSWSGWGPTARWMHGAKALWLSSEGLRTPWPLRGVPRELRRIGFFGASRNVMAVTAIDITPATKALAPTTHRCSQPQNRAWTRETASSRRPWAIVKRRLEKKLCCAAAGDSTRRPNTGRALSEGVQCPHWPTQRRYERKFEVMGTCLPSIRRSTSC